MEKKIDILLCNHFDLTWRRGYKKSIFWEGKEWISYAEVEKNYIDRCIEMCRKDKNFKFNIECAAVLRTYLERNPEREREICELIAEKRLDIPFAGDNIVDSNLVQGESIIRNFLYGWKYLKTLGHDGGKMAYRRDAFGNSAQLPQILLKFGMNWVWALSYSEPDAPIWQGLDGSRIFCADPPIFNDCGSIDKYAPCSTCGGYGTVEGEVCPDCEGMKINWKDSKFALKMPDPTAEWKEYSILPQRSEELIPNWDMLEWPKKLMEGAMTEASDTACARFGTFTDLWDSWKEKVESALSDPKIKKLEGCELNPNNTGVFVTRIETKKQCRECENRMYELEHFLTAAAEKGMEYPEKELGEVWNDMLFLMFHDAITGTVVDMPYDEIMETGRSALERMDILKHRALDYLAEPAGKECSVVNPGLVPWKGNLTVVLEDENPCVFFTEMGDKLAHSKWERKEGKWETVLALPEIQALSSLKIIKSSEPVQQSKEKGSVVAENSGAQIENEWYRISADAHGIVSILCKDSGRIIKEMDGIRIHEIYLENDEGSPWTTLGTDKRRMQLSDRCCLYSIEKNDAFQSLTFNIAPFNSNTVEGVELKWTVTMKKGLKRIDFKLDVEYWDTYNNRIRIAFPANQKGRALYDIPYGTVERRPYECENGLWANAVGDWPGVRWAGITDDTYGMAVINNGAPCYKTEELANGDVLLLTLLRSPCIPTYLHEPRSYDMRAFDGMRDTGSHSFEYGLYLCSGSLEDSDIVRESEAFAIQPVVICGKITMGKIPVVESGCVKLSAYYMSEQKNKILRIYEFRGIGGKAKILFPKQCRVFECNFYEQCGKEYSVEEENDKYFLELELKPFEICTLKLVFDYEA